MRIFLLLVLFFAGSAALAEVLVAARTIRVREIINADDLIRKPATLVGAITDPLDIIGREARVVLYAGRPIRNGDVGPPSIVGRNDFVTLVFSRGPLRIATEGRALGRGSVGDSVRAMNMTSRLIVTGIIMGDGSIEVQ